MSLEEKLSSLKLDDADAVVELVKKDVKGFCESVVALTKQCESKDETEALAALGTVKKLAVGAPEAHLATKETLSACTFLIC